MAYGGPKSGDGRVVLSRFLTLLERLSQEIQKEQLEGLICLLQDRIPAGILENCCTARKLFTCMRQKGLLGENNLDLLEQLLETVNRSDLVNGMIKSFKELSSTEAAGNLPAMELVHFSFAAQRSDFNMEVTRDMLTASMCAALRTCRREELCFAGCQEDVLNWFNLTFEIPNRRELLDILRRDALKKEEWLSACGVKAVMIGDEAQIVLQPITPLASLKNDSSPVLLDEHHSVSKLDMIVVVDCATSNPIVLGHLKTQLIHTVDRIFSKPFHLRLALVSYQNHQLPLRNQSGRPRINSVAHLQNFTDDKEKMKNYIKSLRCFGKRGNRKGLADGLALAVRVSEAVNGDDFKCRKEAVKVCILLPLEDPRGTLDIFTCTHGHDVTKLCRELAGNCVTLYTLMGSTLKHVSPNPPPNPAHVLMAEFFTGISLKTGGQFIHTQSLKLIPEIIEYVIEEDISMERLYGTAHDIVIQEIEKTPTRDVDLEELKARLQDALNGRFCHVNLITFNGSTIGPTSKEAKKFSLDEGMKSICQTFRCEHQKMMTQCMANSPETPRDVNVVESQSESASPRVSSTRSDITNEAAERLLRRVVLRKDYYWPR